MGCLDPFRTQALHQCAGARGCNIGPPTLGCSITGPSCYDRYRQYHCCSLYQQTGCDPFPRPIAAGSRSVSVATDSGHNSLSQSHSGLPQCYSRPVISAEPAHLHPEVMNLIFRLWRTSAVDMSATTHIFPSLAIDALSQDWQWRSMYMFTLFPLLSQVTTVVCTLVCTFALSVCGPPTLLSILP